MGSVDENWPEAVFFQHRYSAQIDKNTRPDPNLIRPGTKDFPYFPFPLLNLLAAFLVFLHTIIVC